MKKYLFIILVILGVLLMLKPVSALIKNSTENIIYRGNIVTGIVATDNGNKSYDCYISESEYAYPKIFTLSRNPQLEVGDKVRILYQNGNKELPIILPPTMAKEEEDNTIVVTLEASSITELLANINGEIIFVGNPGNCTRRGFEYGETTEYGETIYDDGSFGAGTFSEELETTLTESNISYDDSAFFVPGTNVDYSALHNQATAGVYYDKRNGYIGQIYYSLSEVFDIRRISLYFDTQSITTAISNVKLRLYINSLPYINYVGGGDLPYTFNIVAQSGMPTYPHIPPEQGDYYYGNYSGNYGSLNSSNFLLNQYNEITLDPSIINKEGITRIMMRSSRDISATSPPTDKTYAEWVGINSITNRPRLVINYTSLPPITYHYRAFAIDANGDTKYGEDKEFTFL